MFEITPGKELIAQKSSFLASTPDVEVSVFLQKRLGTGLFGGEGLFNTVISGPGHIWLQTMPIARTARTISRYLPTQSD